MALETAFLAAFSHRSRRPDEHAAAVDRHESGVGLALEGTSACPFPTDTMPVSMKAPTVSVGDTRNRFARVSGTLLRELAVLS